MTEGKGGRSRADEKREDDRVERQRNRREGAERRTEEQSTALTKAEKGQVTQHRRLSAVTVYAIVRNEGEEELERPLASLWWSGIAAGVTISTSLLAEAVLWQALEGHPYRETISKLGYTVGFVIVVLSRLQLFTENTISVILPLLAKPTRGKMLQTARLWGIVMVANLVGTFATAFITLTFPVTTSQHVDAMLSVSRRAAEAEGWDAMYLGVPAGFYIAALVWLLPSSKGFEMWVVLLVTYLIALGGFTHVVVGSSEIFMLMLEGELSVRSAMLTHLLPAFVGNVIGGTGLFALLAYGQVRQEI